jgi:ubiquinone/menaquinone biosynthesis C-methylase UbiE
MELPADVVAGQAIYNRATLAVYDVGVLGLSCRLVWRCPKAVMLAAYNRNVGSNHLELGVGTAYFLDRCRCPEPRPRVTLVDLNPTVLKTAAGRISRYRPQTIRANVLEPLPIPGRSYDSVGMNFLLHCLPGDWEAKGAVFTNAAAALRPGGRVFGSTILATGVRTTAPAQALMRLYNSRGIFHNADDDLAGLRAELAGHFADYRLAVRGCVGLFEAHTAPPASNAFSPDA